MVSIHHDRDEMELSPNIFQLRVDLELETRGFKHINYVIDTLKKGGYGISLDR